MRISRKEFERLAAEAIEGLPDEFASRLKNVEFVIEDYPSPEDQGKFGVEPGRLLLGQYQGLPLTKRSVFGGPIMPDRITIFQRNIERICRTHEQVVDEVRKTVLHEIAHHLGISDARLRELGY